MMPKFLESFSKGWIRVASDLFVGFALLFSMGYCGRMMRTEVSTARLLAKTAVVLDSVSVRVDSNTVRQARMDRITHEDIGILNRKLDSLLYHTPRK